MGWRDFAVIPGGSPFRGGLAMGARSGDDGMDEGAMEVTIEELQEFLEADRLPIRANPGFKERLHRRLWELLQARLQRAARDAED
jgi:hypothetical protein